MPEFVISALGVIESGCILSTYNPIYTAHEISTQIQNSDTKLMICVDQNYKATVDAVALSKRDIKIICVKTDPGSALPSGAICFYELMKSGNKDFFTATNRVPDYTKTAFLPYSSGTTGTCPKNY